MKSAHIHTRIVTLALFAVLACLLWAGKAGAATEWQYCRSPLPGQLAVQKMGCPEGQAVIERFAEKAQTRGPRIRVFGFRCHAINGRGPIYCHRGKKRVRYIGGF